MPRHGLQVFKASSFISPNGDVLASSACLAAMLVANHFFQRVRRRCAMFPLSWSGTPPT